MFITPTNPALHTMGRIDTTYPEQPIWVYPYTQVSFRCTGTAIRIRLINHWNYGLSTLGVIIDGRQSLVHIPVNDEPITLTLGEHLPNITHEVIIFKRQDGQHYISILGFYIDDDAILSTSSLLELPRRIECYGDSVSCGERNEAIVYCGKSDPDIDLSSYSNAWYSYIAITARNLHAQLHNISQGGIALYDGIGWFNGPQYTGMENMWNRIQYNPALGSTVPWDFSNYTPHVVVVAIGQNDAHPYDFMAQDYHSTQAQYWRMRYTQFLNTLRSTYPHATIICTTTILEHSAAWDAAIDDICTNMDDPHVHHFMYSRNGCATPGHPRIPEHNEMARELTAFITSLGNEIWQ